MKTNKFLVTVVVLVLAALSLSACGSNAIDLILTNHKVTPSAASAKAGDITFNIKNGSTDLIHEIVLIKSDLAIDKLPLRADGSGRVDETKVDIKGAKEDIPPGKSETLTVNLAAGRYYLVCNVDDHYAKKMYIEFTVTP
ncbi:MAG: cupredoxin domain-containing protein [Chloroflexi bacterium]|nr:cupredoxin domain-containing protein [Chloroflexota bacterium]